MEATGAGMTQKTTVATYGSYAEAERAVDFLSDEGFPVERVAIVGTGLKTVEQVAGRLTTGRAAIAGAGQGAISVFGAVAQAAQGGRRDFASIRGMQAERYELQVEHEHSARAKQLLADLDQPGASAGQPS